MSSLMWTTTSPSSRDSLSPPPPSSSIHVLQQLTSQARILLFARQLYCLYEQTLQNITISMGNILLRMFFLVISLYVYSVTEKITYHKNIIILVSVVNNMRLYWQNTVNNIFFILTLIFFYIHTYILLYNGIDNSRTI